MMNMEKKKKNEEDLEERLLDSGDIIESVDAVIDRILEESDKKNRRYTTG